MEAHAWRSIAPMTARSPTMGAAPFLRAPLVKIRLWGPLASPFNRKAQPKLSPNQAFCACAVHAQALCEKAFA